MQIITFGKVGFRVWAEPETDLYGGMGNTFVSYRQKLPEGPKNPPIGMKYDCDKKPLMSMEAALEWAIKWTQRSVREEEALGIQSSPPTIN